jgi:hypothetical protein
MTLKSNDTHQHEPLPNPLAVNGKYVWREVYQGRWQQLRTVHKIEFLIEVIFFLALFGGFLYGAYAGGKLVNFGLAFVSVGLLLGAFFWLLRRKIR